MDTSQYSAESFVGASSTSFGTSSVQNGSSKAVLAALRALQDKIKRLEAERGQAIDECTHLKNQIRAQEIEAEHSRQRDVLNSQRSLLEAKSAFDRLMSEKASMEEQLHELQSKTRGSQQIIDNQKARIGALEDEKSRVLARQRELDCIQRDAEDKVKFKQNKEKETTESFVLESRRFEEELDTSHSRLRRTEEELNRIVDEKTSYENKLSELDSVVAQLLKVNEGLVAQLQGKYVATSSQNRAPVIASKKSLAIEAYNKPKATGRYAFAGSTAVVEKGAKKKCTKKKGATASNAATAPKPRATRSTANVHARASNVVYSDTLDGEYLNQLHNVYVCMGATDVPDDPVPRGAPPVMKLSRSSRGKNQDQGCGFRGVLHRPQKLSSKSMSDIDDRSSTGRGGSGGGGRVKERKKTRIAYKRAGSDGMAVIRGHSPSRPSFDSSPASTNSNSSGSSSASISSTGDGGGSASGVTKKTLKVTMVRPTPDSLEEEPCGHDRVYTLVSTETGEQGQGQEETEYLQEAIDGLEAEFDALNSQYRMLLNSANEEFEGGGSEVDCKGGGSIARTESLVNVIQKMHSKGEKLLKLRSPNKKK